MFPAHPKETSLIGAVSIPLYITFTESITTSILALREAYCLVSNRQDGYEIGTEWELIEHLRYMDMYLPWEKLGLSLLDVFDITSACFSEDDA